MYELNTKGYLLDLFGFFSSLPLGYNHEIFSSQEFIAKVSEYLSLRASICAFPNSLIQDFYQALVQATDSKAFLGLTLAETGSLAVEQAVKLAFLTHGENVPFCTIQNSYHGIYGLSACLTHASGSAPARLSGQRIRSSDFIALSQPEDLLKMSKVHPKIVLIIEPIRCTAGDFVIEAAWTQAINELKEKNQLCLIVDEVQTGIFSTGTPWAHKKLDLDPDIIVFGKKAQVCGTLSKPEYASKIGGSNPKYFSATYDASPIDLIRGTHLLEYIQYNRNRIVDNISEFSSSASRLFRNAFRDSDIRVHGCLIATTFDCEHQRNHVVNKLLKRRILCNPTGEAHVRFRLPLNFSQDNLTFLQNALSQDILS